MIIVLISALSPAEVPSASTRVVFFTVVIIIIIIIIEIIFHVQERRGERPAVMLHNY